MKLSILLLILPLNLACDQDEEILDLIRRNNIATQAGPLKFHLHHQHTNQFLLIEPSTKLLRVVSSEEFDTEKQNNIAWFTACNHFEPTLESTSHFEICLSGVEEKRLFYDTENEIFMLLNTDKQKSRHSPMSINLIRNKATGQFVKARIMNSIGNLFISRRQAEIKEDESASILEINQ